MPLQFDYFETETRSLVDVDSLRGIHRYRGLLVQKGIQRMMNNNYKESEQYIEAVSSVLTGIKQQQHIIDELAEKVVQAYCDQRVFHVFGTGHSHMLAEEMFYRAGGLAIINPMLDESIMLHGGARKSTSMERVPDLAQIILKHYDVRPGDVLLVISNSGVNPLPVQMVLEAKKMGLYVAALTSRATSVLAPKRHESKKTIVELSDLVLDNMAPPGDAVISIGDYRVCALSTVSGAIILQCLVALATKRFLDMGLTPPIFKSANIEGGDAHNLTISDEFAGRLKHL
jgi:uncharacterized phosphosugar-binding protein